MKSYQGGLGKYVWVFDQRMLDAFGDAESMKRELAKIVREAIDGNGQKVKRELMSDLGLDITNTADVSIFNREVIGRLREMFEATPNTQIGN